jgi:hypothetical protein
MKSKKYENRWAPDAHGCSRSIEHEIMRRTERSSEAERDVRVPEEEAIGR